MSPIPASPELRRLSTRKPELVCPQPLGRAARDLEVEAVLAFFDLDRLGDRFAVLFSAQACSLYLPGGRLRKLEATAWRRVTT